MPNESPPLASTQALSTITYGPEVFQEDFSSEAKLQHTLPTVVGSVWCNLASLEKSSQLQEKWWLYVLGQWQL